MSKIKHSKFTIPTAALAALAAIATPAAAVAAPGDEGKDLKGYEKTYLDVRADFVETSGREAAGRNIVRWGQPTKDGDVRPATKAEVLESTSIMEPAPVEPATTATSTESAPATGYDTSGAPTEVIECESGGDYGAVNPAGYYGAYQFDQGTWDAYAPEGYAGVNPAEAPPEVQDAAAAAVPYDAWPNC